MVDGSSHIPVMLSEVVSDLSPKCGEVYVDGTFGGGGYTRAILDSADCRVIAIDRDCGAVERALEVAERPEYKGRLVALHGCFGDAENLLKTNGYGQVDGFVLDIGVSSFQIDEAKRGFSFQKDAPLDMRMDTKGEGKTAAELVNNLSEDELADIIYYNSGERKARRIARRIVEERRKKPIETTFELAGIVRSVVPRSHKDNLDPATRTFQALRIAVNDELGELKRGLHAAELVLKSGGRLVVVSFHSLEDRIVKEFLKERSGGKRKVGVSRYLPEVADDAEGGIPQTFELVRKKVLKPSQEEVSRNARARSARLRAAVRTDVPVMVQEGSGMVQ